MTSCTIKRTMNYAESGEYDLTIDGTTYQIYRDTFQFSYLVWYCVQLPKLFEYTKKDIIQKIMEYTI